MTTIEEKRKELIGSCGNIWCPKKAICTDCENKLKGFNLGVELASQQTARDKQKEFLDKYKEIDEDPKNNDNNSQYWKWQFISKYIEELKKAVKEK